jgi:hypothetical protein
MQRRVIVSKIVSLLAAVVIACSASNARADIVFCNKFAATVFVAIAYPQDNGAWMSRGWLELATGECRPFDTAIQVTALYYRGVSASFKDASGQQLRIVWGGPRKFATWVPDNFEYWDAEHQVLKSSLQGYTAVAESIVGTPAITVTFEADGKHTTTTINH